MSVRVISRWPWMATCKALSWDPGSLAVVDPATKWSMSCNTLLWPLLGLTGGPIGPIQSIGWSCQALAPICFIPTVLLNLCLQQVPNPYLLGARRWLRVKCVERIGICPVLRTWNWKLLGNLQLTRETRLNQSEWVSPLVHWTPWWMVESKANEKYTAYMVSSN